MAAPRGLGKGLDVMIPNIVGETKEKSKKRKQKKSPLRLLLLLPR